ncbi:marine proteobacterial sortase target protein [Shewanella algae]|uniref:marine proteobacterial sortase target protein n=1 Tax=Shewanella algae TaxID=38313 RepID=UPI001F2DD7D8|nr:marine proteobacterial sortase target protein [Shewanella algae]MCE9774508.1 marine proteobacterial sortase target protein [Shewanella algae]
MNMDIPRQENEQFQRMPAASHSDSDTYLCRAVNALQFSGFALLALLVFNLVSSVEAWAENGPQLAEEPASAQAQEDTLQLIDNPQWPGAGVLAFGDTQAPALATEVSMNISGWSNRVSVTQSFTNDTQEWIHGRYLFPLPNEAAVDSMQLRIGERIIEGVIQPKEEAKRTFEQAKAQGKRASLLSQERPNLFTTQVANLAPGETLRVSFSYQQALDYRIGQFSLRFPMTHTPRYLPQSMLQSFKGVEEAARLLSPVIEAASLEKMFTGDDGESSEPIGTQAHSGGQENRLSLDIILDAGFPLLSLESPYHAISQQTLSDGRIRVQLQQDNTKADSDFVLQWQADTGAKPAAALFSQQGQTHTPAPFLAQAEGQAARDEYSLLMLMPPQSKEVAKPLPRELILVIDTSGSMGGDAIVQAKQALLYALSSLKSEDSFNVVEFNSAVQTMAANSLPATAHNIGRAQQFIRALEANGGTEMAKALELALNNDFAAQNKVGTQGEIKALRQVIFMTDGAVGNEQALFELIKDRLGENRLFTVGIGSAPNSHFMQRAAELGRGSFTYIGKMQEVEQKVVALLEKISAPRITDVSLRYPDGTVPDYWPAQIPDLYQGEPVLVSIKQRSNAHKAVIVSGLIDGQFWQQELALNAKADPKGLDLIWARKQIAALELAKDAANSERIERQVTALSLKYHLVSPYTSLVAVDVTPVNPDAAATREGQVASHAPKGWQGKLPQTATDSRLMLLLGLASLLAALMLAAFPRAFGRRACEGAGR